MAEVPQIDIRPDHWAIVSGILRQHVPQYEVWAFGSRAKWTAKQYSDLDLAVITDQPLPLAISAALSDDFSESDLPYKVDVVDWATTGDSFRRIIERDRVVIQKGKPGGGMAGEWPTTKIGDVCLRITKGTTPTTGGGAFSNSGIAFIKVEAITESGGFLPEKFAFIDAATDERLARSRLKEHDILFTIAGTIGRVAQVTSDVLPANTNQAVAIIRPSRDVIYPRFLYYVLRDSKRIKLAQSKVVQSVQANFSLGELSTIEIPLPSLEEQRAIASILGALDDKIELNRRTNETLEAIARALFKSWFVDFNGVPAQDMQQSELGLIPKGWRVGALADLCELNASKWIDKKHPATVRYIDLSGVSANRIFVFDEAPSRARIHLREGDTIVGTVRPGNRAFAYIHKPEANLTGSTGFAVLSPKQPHYASFVYLAATRDEAIERLANLADGAAYPVVRPNVVAETPCVIAPDEVVAEFSVVTKPMLERIAQNSEHAAMFATLRDTLLPKLLSGELSVQNISEETTN